MRIYVGNLSRETTEDELKGAFERFGGVASVAIITDKFSGQSKGFGFVEMPDDAESRAAMENLNAKEFMGRTLVVNEARPRTERSGGRRGYGGGGGRRGGGGNRGGDGGHRGGFGRER